MNANEIPQKILHVLTKKSIQPENVNFVLTSDLTSQGTTGESWLVGISNRLVLFSAEMYSEPEAAIEVPLEKIAQVIISKTFLRNLLFKFFNRNGEELQHFEVSQVYSQQWEEYINKIKEKFPGKTDETEEEPNPFESGMKFDSPCVFGTNSDIISEMTDAQLFKTPSLAVTDYNPGIDAVTKKEDTYYGNSLESNRLLNSDGFSKSSDFSLPNLANSTDQPPDEPAAKPNKRYKKDEKIQEKKAPKPGEVECQNCHSMNLADYDYCLNCGSFIQKKKQEKKAHKYIQTKSASYGSSAENHTGEDEAAGCISQIFKTIFWVCMAYLIISILK
ncbi:MAG: hypothetical protein HQM10_01730 [Candidatus Riflebacteria bacterium]|nr:hypothetical protein [Candidatus Riflebacteria bacterium]